MSLNASASSESRLAGQWLRFKVFAARKHCTRHTGLGAKCCTEVTTATLGATTTAQLSTAMGSGAPGDARPANPTEFRDGDMILQLPADRCHPCTQTHCYCLGLHGTGPCCWQQVLETVRPRPGATLPPWATLPRPPLMPPLRPTAVLHLTSWRWLCSLKLLIRNIHWLSCKDPHYRLCRKDPGSCSHTRIIKWIN